MIPTYNRPTLLSEAVGSALSQDVSSFEVLVVDDGSDPPVAMVDDPRVRLLRLLGNQGPSAARNAGIDAAQGRYLVFLDDDDLFTPDRLALALEGLERAPVAICWSRFHEQPPGRNRVLEGDVAGSILNGLTPSLGATAVRADIAPRFDPHWNAVEDVEWWLRLAHRAPVTTVRTVGYLVRRHDGTRHRNHPAARLDENLRLLEKEAPYFASCRSAAAFRLRRAGLLALEVGDRRVARGVLIRSLRLKPRVATLRHLIRAIG